MLDIPHPTLHVWSEQGVMGLSPAWREICRAELFSIIHICKSYPLEPRPWTPYYPYDMLKQEKRTQANTFNMSVWLLIAKLIVFSGEPWIPCICQKIGNFVDLNFHFEQYNIFILLFSAEDFFFYFPPTFDRVSKYISRLEKRNCAQHCTTQSTLLSGGLWCF